MVCTYEVDGREYLHPVSRDLVMGLQQATSARDGDRIQGTVGTTRPPVRRF